MTVASAARRSRAGAGGDRPRTETVLIAPHSLTTTSMGGSLAIHLDAAGRDGAAERDGRRVIARIDRWASRLTRHTDTSDLALLNADPSASVPVRPTLAAALLAGVAAADVSEGFAVRRRRGTAVVRRPPGLHFDLGGVGKGWIADRALTLLEPWRSAVVDADGDLAVLSAPGKRWEVGIDDPRQPNSQLAVLRLEARADGAPTRWGVATSGTSIHRWSVGGTATHHLIDPRTGLPAITDVVQATVVAGSALRAEALAKAAVIAGAVEGFALLERAHVLGAVLLTASGKVLALPVTMPLLAD